MSTPAHIITVKITHAARDILRLVADQTGEQQYRVLSRLLEAEIQRLSSIQKGKQPSDSRFISP